MGTRAGLIVPYWSGKGATDVCVEVNPALTTKEGEDPTTNGGAFGWSRAIG